MAVQSLSWKIDLTRAALSFGRLVPLTGNTYNLSISGGESGESYTFYVMDDDGLTCLAKSSIASGSSTPSIAFNTEALRNRFDGGWHELRVFHTVASDGTSTVAEGDLPILWNPVWTDISTGTAATMKGDKGDKGDAATVAIGTVTTGDPGSNASVTNAGTAYAAVLNFLIPKGAKGDTGDTGPANTLSIGYVLSGSTPAATITGTAPNQTLNLVLPKGENGSDGEDGSDGNDGATPYINGNNKHWIIGTVDTGVVAEGTKGDTGDTPVITGSKTGGTTTIYSDGMAIATILDGETPTNCATKPTTGGLADDSSLDDVIAKINTLITQLKS